MPLGGKRILVTSAGSKGKDFSAKLKEFGAQAILMPMIEINDPDSWQALDSTLGNLNSYQWLVFASSNAVTAFVKRLAHHKGLDGEKLFGEGVLGEGVLGKRVGGARTGGARTGEETAGGEKKTLPETLTKALPKIAVIGPVTAKVASDYGLIADYCPSNYLAEDFIAQFPGYPDHLTDTHILWPRTNLGRDLIMEKLQEAKAVVDVVPAYKTDLPKNSEELHKQLLTLVADKGIEAITIASKQTAINLAKILCLDIRSNDISRNLQSSAFGTGEVELYLQQLLANILIVTIGPEASEGALNYLGKVNLEAEPHTGDGMINTLVKYYRSNCQG